MICISELNRQVAIESAQQSSDGAGGSNIAWSEIGVVWAKIRSAHSGEKSDNDVLSASVRHKITIRFRDDLKPDMRFVLGQRLFDILSIINVNEQDVWLECLCREVLV